MLKAAILMATATQSLAVVSGSHLEVWNYFRHTRKSAALSIPLKVDSCSRWVWMRTGLFCSGGFGHGDGTKEAYEVGQSGRVVRLLDMKASRSNHGLWFDWARERVFVFGGGGVSFTGDHGTTQECTVYVDCNNYKDLRTCEVLGGGRWRELPGMQEARADFNPCAFGKRVYVCGYPSVSIEAFDPEACVFHQLQVHLLERSACLLVVENNQLLVLTDNYATRWEAGQHHSLRQISQTQHSMHGKVCNAPPVLDSVNSLLYITAEGVCFSISLEDGVKRRAAID